MASSSPCSAATRQDSPRPTTTNEWGLLGEPWVFVVDGDGIVQSSLLLMFSDEELEAAIAQVEGTGS